MKSKEKKQRRNEICWMNQHCNNKLLREISSPFVIWMGLDYFLFFFSRTFYLCVVVLKSGTKQRENFGLFYVWFKCFRNSKQKKEMKMRIKEGFLFLGNAEKTKKILSWFLALCFSQVTASTLGFRPPCIMKVLGFL